MVKYLLTSTAFAGEIEFRFDGQERLQFFHNRSEMSDAQYAHLCNTFPFTYPQLVALCSASRTLTLARISEPVTWEMFYNRYGYKVGNKVRAKRLFDALSETDAQEAYDFIPGYDAYLAARPRMEKAYPETYLNQRRWENELPK